MLRVPIVAIDCDGWGAVDYLRLRGVLPTPVKTRTRKGFHLFYRHPGVPVATRIKVDGRPGRCRRGLTVARVDRTWCALRPFIQAGLSTKRWADRWTAQQLADMPTFEPSWFPPAPAVLSDRKPLRSVFPERSERTLTCAEQSLLRMHPAIQGQCGGRATIVAALMLARRFQLDEDQIFDLLSRSYNPRCVPPWSERELRQRPRRSPHRSEFEP